MCLAANVSLGRMCLLGVEILFDCNARALACSELVRFTLSGLSKFVNYPGLDSVSRIRKTPPPFVLGRKEEISGCAKFSRPNEAQTRPQPGKYAKENIWLSSAHHRSLSFSSLGFGFHCGRMISNAKFGRHENCRLDLLFGVFLWGSARRPPLLWLHLENNSFALFTSFTLEKIHSKMWSDEKVLGYIFFFQKYI